MVISQQHTRLWLCKNDYEVLLQLRLKQAIEQKHGKHTTTHTSLPTSRTSLPHSLRLARHRTTPCAAPVPPSDNFQDPDTHKHTHNTSGRQRLVECRFGIAWCVSLPVVHVTLCPSFLLTKTRTEPDQTTSRLYFAQSRPTRSSRAAHMPLFPPGSRRYRTPPCPSPKSPPPPSAASPAPKPQPLLEQRRRGRVRHRPCRRSRTTTTPSSNGGRRWPICRPLLPVSPRPDRGPGGGGGSRGLVVGSPGRHGVIRPGGAVVIAR